MKIINNYHTHTPYCNHCVSTIDEQIEKAIELNLKTIGFSEHAPLKIKRKFRLNLHDVDNYLANIQVAKEKYKDRIKVLAGFECEYCKEEYTFYKALKERKGCDYLIFGNHNWKNPHFAVPYSDDVNSIEDYTKQFIEGCESGLFSMIAHPDLILRYRGQWSEIEIKHAKIWIDTAIKFNIPLGFNVNGLLNKKNEFYYPSKYFFELVSKSKAKVIIEVDSHDIKTYDKLDEAYELIKKYGIEENIVYELEIR